ncbi:hypothetical protein [Streptomyces sp. NPDC127038]|uniref:hypothetical protein n=1 Tax=Streptomyces sp. NPDC127038 TaxID=3347114 RepID=UPI00365C2833
MAIADDIEFYGRAVDAGDMTRDAAIAALAQRGGFTEAGAGDVIDNWQAARSQFQQTFRDAAASLDKIYGLDDIQP